MRTMRVFVEMLAGGGKAAVSSRGALDAASRQLRQGQHVSPNASGYPFPRRAINPATSLMQRCRGQEQFKPHEGKFHLVNLCPYVCPDLSFWSAGDVAAAGA